MTNSCVLYRQATEEQTKDAPRNGQGQGREEQEGEISDTPAFFTGGYRLRDWLGNLWLHFSRYIARRDLASLDLSVEITVLRKEDGARTRDRRDTLHQIQGL